MQSNPSEFLPASKMETEKAEAIVALGYPKVEPILPELVEWMQDMNWPVAKVFQPFLASIGAPLAPHIRRVLESDDEMWKFWVLRCIVSCSTELVQILKPDLVRLAYAPSEGEQAHEINIHAQRLLAAVADAR